MNSDAFRMQHFDPPTGPVLLSVPHAGRAYDPAVLTGLRVPVASTLLLEDRYADRLANAAIAARVPTIIAHTPRLMIDLNRAPDDLDPDLIRGGFGGGAPASAKARAGLGLVPTRLWGVGPLWRTALDPNIVAERVTAVHAPYHAAIAAGLDAARRRYGEALLLDLHSMPPIRGDDAPDIVIGDRFGATAATQITATAEAVLKGMGFRVAINAPYAGGYIVSRHAAPHRAIHAVQIEVDRRLYLDDALNEPGDGLARLQAVILTLIESLGEELTGRFAAAAE
jgi:N-formylglutamate amidohydrolase